jgi:hypothetical protein
MGPSWFIIDDGSFALPWSKISFYDYRLEMKIVIGGTFPRDAS